MRIVIPILRDPKDPLPISYIGTGTVKQVLIRSGDAFLTVTMQIDLINPNNGREDQEVPSTFASGVIYDKRLSYRIIFDSDIVEAHKKQVQANLNRSKVLHWEDAKYDVT